MEKPDVENYKQETLVKTFLNMEYDAHNALADVQFLQTRYKKIMTDFLYSSDLFTLNYYACKKPLDPSVKDKVIFTNVIHLMELEMCLWSNVRGQRSLESQSLRQLQTN